MWHLNLNENDNIHCNLKNQQESTDINMTNTILITLNWNKKKYLLWNRKL
jgi:hypothetical protein